MLSVFGNIFGKLYSIGTVRSSYHSPPRTQPFADILQKGPPCPDSAIFSLVFTFRFTGFLLAHLDHFGPATGHPSTFNSPSSHS
jgi:hypothetical protein